jgi:ATP-binding cassette subfamily B protein
MTFRLFGASTEVARQVLRFSAAHWHRQHRLAAVIGGIIVLATLAEVLMPLYAGRLVDVLALDMGSAGALDAARSAFLTMIALGAAVVVLRHLAYRGIETLTLRMMGDVAREAFWRVQRFSTDWHANSFAGSTVRKITRGMWAFDLMNDTLLLALLPSLVVLAGSTVLLGARWPIMGFVVALGTMVYVAMTLALSLAYVGPAATLSNAWDTRTGGALADAIGCNAVVKAFGAEAREDRRLARLIGKWQRRTRRTWMRGTRNGSAQNLVLLGLRAAVIGAALWLWSRGRATPGDLTYVLTAYLVIHGYLRDIGMHVRNLQRSINDLEELVTIHAEPLGIEDRPDARPILVGEGRIVFERVRFHYPGHATPLYRDLSVTIGAGEKVGVVGHSGSGKTTFVKLIQRLHDVAGGRILIDGQDIAAARQASLRAQIAIVPQEPILFHRSLAENIAYACPDAPMDRIEHAARLANAHEFIMRLPRGYATLVGERGVKLSGGERQRVALARAFLADAPILILDEATSSLDSRSETLIQEAIERLMAGRTAIVIAHRLSTVRALDRILVFERGQVVEEGSHAELVRRSGGLYRELFEHQATGLVQRRTAGRGCSGMPAGRAVPS